MTISLIAAVARNGVIGRDNGLPWRLSTDLRRFKSLTLGHPIVMGRKTWESFPKRPLPDRTNIVITRDRGFSADGALVAHSLDEALALARRAPGGDRFVAVIGGGEIYRQSIARAGRLDITHVAVDAEGDAHFPNIDPKEWQEISGEDVPSGDRDEHASRYVVYARRPI